MMDPAKYQYQSEFAKRYVAQGRADIVLRQLAVLFGPLPADVAARVSASSSDDLDAIGERLLTAESLDEALGPQ